MNDETPKATVSANAEVSAKFQATAGQSQTVLLSLVGTNLALFLLSAYFFSTDKFSPAILFFLLGAVSFGALLVMWSKSQADSDLAAAVPTSITAADGTKLSTDVRALTSPKALENLVKVVEVLLNRRPLPRPAGLVGPQGELVPGTEDVARTAVDNINRDISSMTDRAIDELGLSDPNMGNLQMHIPEEPPRALLDATPPPETNVSSQVMQHSENARPAA
jgi:hypothetical protein